MRRIKVYLESGYSQVPDRHTVIEVDDDYTDQEINEEAFDAISG